MQARFSFALSLVAAGLTFLSWTWLAGEPEWRVFGAHDERRPLPGEVLTQQDEISGVTVRPVRTKPSDFSPRDGVSRFAAPRLLHSISNQAVIRRDLADRSSHEELVTAVADTPKKTAGENVPASLKAPERNIFDRTDLTLERPPARISQDATGRAFATPVVVPMPRLVKRSDVAHLLRLPLHKAQTALVPLSSSPFPYDGKVPGKANYFLNASLAGRLAHRTGSGRLYFADETYSDNRSLFHLPRGFDVNAPAAIVLFFHGHGATLERDVWRRQQLPRQITESGANVALLAPQFAVDARDSSIGRFWQAGALRRYLDEAARELARLYGAPEAEAQFANMPLIIVGYSGGYLPTAWGLANGDINSRIRGIVLLDALYGYTATFKDFIVRNRRTFFISAYGQYTRDRHTDLRSALEAAGITVGDSMPESIKGGTVALIDAPARHRDYVTNAWDPFPVAEVLRRLPGLSQISSKARFASRR